jgi:hypothetical protein
MAGRHIEIHGWALRRMERQTVGQADVWRDRQEDRKTEGHWTTMPG